MRSEKTESYDFLFEGDFSKKKMKSIIDVIESKLNLHSRQNNLLETVLSFKNNSEALLINVKPALDEWDTSSFKGTEGFDFLKIIVKELDDNGFKYKKDKVDYKRYNSVTEWFSVDKEVLFPEKPVKLTKGMKP